MRHQKKDTGKNARQGVRGVRGGVPRREGFATKTHSPCVRKGCRLCAEGRGHPKLIFTFRENGKLRGLYVRAAHEAALRAAIENGRELERLLVEAGRDLVLGWRGRDDAK